jgi:hypothetical protein
MHIICAHTHRLALGYDISGKYHVVESGHCRDQERTLYKQMETTTHPEWNPGFVLLLNGIPHLIDKKRFPHYVDGRFGRRSR